MNFPFYIAKRYLVSKKSHNIINIISGISIVGISVGTMALIVVLSVFNGFENLVLSLFNSFNPDLVIQAKEGKTFNTRLIPEDSLKKIPGVVYYSDVIEENALIKSKSKQHIVTLKGVEEEFRKISRIDSAVFAGEARIDKNKNFALLGAGVAYYLDINIYDYSGVVHVYVPNRDARPGLNLESAFNRGALIPSGIFSIQQDIDTKYIIVPLHFAQNLLDYDQEVTAIELGLDENADAKAIQKTVQEKIGDDFIVKNRFQQQQILYSIMKSEKWVVFLILTFILIIASFNMVGSLTMLILDKKRDIGILHSMGATQKAIRRVFIYEGILISMISAIAGLVIGAVICLIQQNYGIIKLGSEQGSFVVDAYPVKTELIDFVFVFSTVMIIGLAASWLPSRQISLKRLLKRFM